MADDMTNSTASDGTKNPSVTPLSTGLTPSDYVIIGGTGDLALRKILPALFWRYLDGQITTDYRIAAASRRAISPDEFAGKLRPFCEDAFASGRADADSWDAFLSILTMLTLDVASGDGGDALAAFIESRADVTRPAIYYLAIAPSLFGKATNLLQATGLVTPQARLVVEKPLGHDGASSRAINAELAEIFDEAQIYRIDHYLGKETVQNLMALRFANVIFETQWNNNHIDHVQISVAETVGVDGRADYYDSYGALRDMVQNHLLQLVCLVAMEPPAFFDADQVRDEKLRVLRAIRPVSLDEVVCGQYQEYETELGRPSNTETYVAMKLAIENWRWAGVPFYIRTGKQLARRASEIVITFKQRPHDIFRRNGNGAIDSQPNRLIIRLQPSEGLRLQLISKQPGPGGMRLFPSELNLSFDDTFNERLPDAYERLLMDTARGNQTLFMRRDEVFAAWDIIDPILEQLAGRKPELYSTGSMGPADGLLEADGRRWIDPYDD
ncbi:MAG: Glucose-6-phosphate 1-dehydrogenase [SAR116 cluster bacterium]|nr:MAG: Glucose-6-phosphate 1-dehydrogenase [SAR116 cluster bacterium]